MTNLLFYLGVGAVIGMGAYIISCVLVSKFITWFGTVNSRLFDLQGAFAPRYFFIGATIGIICAGAMFVGPMKAGRMALAYDDLCLTLHRSSLADVIGDDYADGITGQYLDSSFEANCRYWRQSEGPR